MRLCHTCVSGMLFKYLYLAFLSMNCAWKCAVPGAFLPGLQVPKTSLKESRNAFLWNVLSKIKEQTRLSVGSPGRSKCSESFPGILKQEFTAGGIAGQGQPPGALAQQGRGTGTTCFTLGGSQCLEFSN